MTTHSRPPRLFGIEQSNRSHDDMWGKNCFNSAFPVALACYMRAQGVSPIYVCVEKSASELTISNEEIPVDQVFNAPNATNNIPNEELRFVFEEKFEPHLKHVIEPDQLDKVDLVIQHNETFLRALQVKLTVVPDSVTGDQDEKKWAPEIVLRPADTISCVLEIYSNIADDPDKVRKVKDIFRHVCSNIQDWNNHAEILSVRDALFNCIEKFILDFHNLQQPCLLQQIWKTKGKSPDLAEDALDIFIWSDYALIATYLKQARLQQNNNEVNRACRAVARLARVLYELSSSADGKIDIRKIYKTMPLGNQTDKEISMSGSITRQYMTSPRRHKPCLGPEVLQNIILNMGHKKLSPERRFDQTIYFTAEKYFAKNKKTTGGGK